MDELLPETTPNEGNYVRTFLPSDSLASVNSVRTRLSARFGRLPGDSGVGISSRSLFEVEEKSRTDQRLDVYLLRLGTFRAPGLTTSGRLRLRQDVQVARARSGWTIDLTGQVTRSLSELASGVESRAGSVLEVEGGYRFTASVQAAVRLSRQGDQARSALFASRRYDLTSHSLSPSLRMLRGRLSSTFSPELSLRVDRDAGRDARSLRLPVTARWAIPGQGDVTGRFELSDIRLQGPPASGLAEFALTDGRGTGRSYLWGLAMQWTLSATLRATVAYDGRAPSEGPVIQTGRIQLSAVF